MFPPGRPTVRVDTRSTVVQWEHLSRGTTADSTTESFQQENYMHHHQQKRTKGVL